MVGVVSVTQLLADKLWKVPHLFRWRFGNDILQDPPTWLKNKLRAIDVKTADGQLTDRSTGLLWLGSRFHNSCVISLWPRANPPLSQESTAWTTYTHWKVWVSAIYIYTVDNLSFAEHTFEFGKKHDLELLLEKSPKSVCLNTITPYGSISTSGC